MGMLQEFKEFAMKGNVVDMAVGIIIGAEFGKIVNSLVNDVIMPPIGLAIGGVNFKDLKVIIQKADAATGVSEVAVGYGAFLQSTFNFIIIAFAIFMMIKAINTLRKDTVSGKA
jgi:large conductance mechanosensitive channel